MKRAIWARLQDNTALGNYALTPYDGTNADTANANVTYDVSTGKGTLAFTMTDSACYDMDWNFTTPFAADVVLYNVASVPEIQSVGGTPVGSGLDLSWSGSELDELDSIAFSLVTDPEKPDDAGCALTKLTDGATITSCSTSVLVPANVPSGDYYIRAVYVRDGVVNGVAYSSGAVRVTNPDTPADPAIFSVAPDGDLTLRIRLQNPSADAYRVNLYEYVYDEDTQTWDWAYSDVNNLVFDAADLTDDGVSVGGSYTYNGSVCGLSAETPYRMGITACHYVDGDGDGTEDTEVCSSERYYSSVSTEKTVAAIVDATSVTLPVPTPPEVRITADRTAQAVARSSGTQTVFYDTYTQSDLTFTMTASEAVTGTWALDEGNTIAGTITGQRTATIALNDLSEGDHTLIIRGQDAGGDGFRKTYLFTVDTLAPKLLLSSPTNGSFFQKDGTLTVTGSTDADALFTVASDGVPVCAGKRIPELGGTIASDGTFSFTVALPDAHSRTTHHVVISASDAVGNQSCAEADVIHSGLSDIACVHVYADGVMWSNGNLNTNALTSRTAQLTLVATTGTGVRFVLTDESMVSWTCFAAEGMASVTDSGLLTMGADSVGYVAGALRVASFGSLTSSLTFGAERYGGSREVVTGTTLGGSVTGGGKYNVGDTVTLTANPDPGYYFTGWTLSGVSVSDTSSGNVTFAMPDGNVVATAGFAADQSGNSARSVMARAGSKVSFRLPAGADETCFVAYYRQGGGKVYVPMSAVMDGYLVFVAPVSGIYYMEENTVSFGDTAGHWAEDYSMFAAARGLFGGVGNSRFSPNGTMTRAMFVTVLWRLAGKPAADNFAFRDVEAGAWYSEAVSWASANGIVKGYGNGLFGTNDSVTREQMCVIFMRYLKYAGYNFPETTEPSKFHDEASISGWAAEAVRVCHSLGIIKGKGSGLFDPLAVATRAEGCAAFCRLIKAFLASL